MNASQTIPLDGAQQETDRIRLGDTLWETQVIPAILLHPLFRGTLELGEPECLPDPSFGWLAMLAIREAAFEGERLRGRLAGGGALDTTRLAPPGIATLDMRFTLRTDDGALVYVEARGRADVARGLGSSAIYGSILFQTSAPAYAWLNALQGVWKGTFDPATRRLACDCYELR